MAKKKIEENKKIDKKQLIVGIIILLVAGLILGYSFYEMNKSNLSDVQGKTEFKKYSSIEEKPQNVNLIFETTTEKDFEYQIYYTQSMDENFTEESSVKVKNIAGTNTYKASLPVKSIARIRINFRVDTDNILVKSIKLTGTQEADLSDVSKYVMGQCNNIDIKDDGSFSMTIMPGGNSYILYMSEISKNESQEENSEEKQETSEENSEVSETEENQSKE